MKFYRSIKPIKAISFDLDDTLYSNRPNMVAAEKAMSNYFSEQLARFIQGKNIVFNKQYWWPFRRKIIKAQPQLVHDVTALRLHTYRQGIADLGVPEQEAKAVAEQAVEYFLVKRSDFIVPEASKILLKTLAKKVPLVAISNGNVDLTAIGLAEYFSFTYLAGKGLLKKPHGDMFIRASKALDVPLSNILHVGDCGYADIQGALRAGMQTAWLSCFDVGKPITVLPHVELTEVTQLCHLLSE